MVKIIIAKNINSLEKSLKIMFSKIFQWKNMFLNTKRPVIAINKKYIDFGDCQFILYFLCIKKKL